MLVAHSACRLLLLLIMSWYYLGRKGVGARKKAHVSGIRAIVLAILHHKETPCLSLLATFSSAQPVVSTILITFEVVRKEFFPLVQDSLLSS